MSHRFTVHDIERARRGSGNVALLAISGYEGRLYRLPINTIEFLAIDEVRSDAVVLFSPHDQLMRVMRGGVLCINIYKYEERPDCFLAVANLVCFEQEDDVVLRAGTAIALALQCDAEMSIEPEVIAQLERMHYRGPIPFEAMQPANTRVC